MLYALPDHQVMENLLPGINDKHLPVDQAVERLHSQPGLIPVAINPTGNGTVYFSDIGDTPLLEWKFIYTIQRLAREHAIDEMFATDLTILEREDLIADGIPPDGLIFHVSRCGSTLFTKALARSPYNLTINQGGPLQEGFWAAITDHWQHQPEISKCNIDMLRNLVLLMARKRRPEYRRCFVKFISWNIIYLDLIRSTFPNASGLYLYREPIEVIATVLQETTAVLRAKGQRQAYMLTGLSPAATREMSDVEYLAHCYAHYFGLVLNMADTDRLQLINYRQLKHAESFADILARGLNLRVDDAELEQMREQYRYDSKDDSDRTSFVDDKDTVLEKLSREDKQIIERICGEKFAHLNASERNLFPSA